MEQLIDSIGRQLQHLERENKGISSFNIDDITVFYANETATTAVHFAITNEDKIHDINDKNNLVITTPYPKEKPKVFHSPELKEFLSKKTIPYEIHFKSGYYSFGLLCLRCYVSRNAATLIPTATLASIRSMQSRRYCRRIFTSRVPGKAAGPRERVDFPAG
jgi:hypothetical protein